MKSAPTDKEVYGWRNTTSKDTALQAMKDAPINTPTAN